MENTQIYSQKESKSNKVKINIQRKFIGLQSLTDVFIPVIYEDICRKLEDSRTIDNKGGTT